MSNYRIVEGDGYNGCLPITVYWVQVRERGVFCDKWRDIKGFEDYRRAKELLNMLKGGK